MNRTPFLASLVLGFLVAGAAHAQTTSPGKTAVHAQATGNLNTVGDITTMTGQILKGKAKSVVEINATISIMPSSNLPGAYLRARINGINANHGNTYSQCQQVSSDRCLITATFWADIDALETANPGSFVGQPLDIEIAGGNVLAYNDPLAYWATFTARMGKK